ncbi:MAG: hypothetical protein ACD_62C00091G0002 [uncultured bacterium]|nr:MAG: hypothetical protein ACD_62C00091G0002 [uncultured bacterium]HLD44063.1 hypothetical protein [bacterium]
MTAVGLFSQSIPLNFGGRVAPTAVALPLGAFQLQAPVEDAPDDVDIGDYMEPEICDSDSAFTISGSEFKEGTAFVAPQPMAQTEAQTAVPSGDQQARPVAVALEMPKLPKPYRVTAPSQPLFMNEIDQLVETQLIEGPDGVVDIHFSFTRAVEPKSFVKIVEGLLYYATVKPGITLESDRRDSLQWQVKSLDDGSFSSNLSLKFLEERSKRSFWGLLDRGQGRIVSCVLSVRKSDSAVRVPAHPEDRKILLSIARMMGLVKLP